MKSPKRLTLRRYSFATTLLEFIKSPCYEIKKFRPQMEVLLQNPKDMIHDTIHIKYNNK